MRRTLSMMYSPEVSRNTSVRRISPSLDSKIVRASSRDTRREDCARITPSASAPEAITTRASWTFVTPQILMKLAFVKSATRHLGHLTEVPHRRLHVRRGVIGVDLEGAEVTLVDPDDPRPELDRATRLVSVVHLDERVETA